MGYKVILRQGAIDDLAEIVTYICQDDPRTAERVGNEPTVALGEAKLESNMWGGFVSFAVTRSEQSRELPLAVPYLVTRTFDDGRQSNHKSGSRSAAMKAYNERKYLGPQVPPSPPKIP